MLRRKNIRVIGQREAGSALLDEVVRTGLSGEVTFEPGLNHYGAVAILERGKEPSRRRPQHMQRP